MATCCNGATYRRLERVARIISHSRGFLIPAKSERSLEYLLPLLPPHCSRSPLRSLPFSPLLSSNHSTHTRIFCIFKLLHFAHFYDKQNFCTDIRHQRIPNHSPTTRSASLPLPPFGNLLWCLACSWGWRPSQLSVCRTNRERERPLWS